MEPQTDPHVSPIPCGRCHGTGTLKSETYVVKRGMAYPRVHEKSCDTCDGDGYATCTHPGCGRVAVVDRGWTGIVCGAHGNVERGSKKEAA